MSRPWLVRHEPFSPWRYFTIIIAIGVLTGVLVLMVTAPPADAPPPVTDASYGPATEYQP